MRIPDPAMVLLVGASGSGKSAWAAAHYRPTEVVSSDALRAVVGSGTADLDASDEAFSILDQVVAGRTRRGLTVVIDTLGLDPEHRTGWAALARKGGLAAVAVVVDTPAATCRARNAARDRPVPAYVLNTQLHRMRDVQRELEAEGWVVHIVSGDESGSLTASSAGSGAGSVKGSGAGSTAGSGVGSGEVAAAPDRGSVTSDGPRVMLQVSSFPWGEDPLDWLRGVALAADEAGFAGIALMDHLIQIPQVGRAWDPIPEPWVTLGALAGLGTDLELGTLCTPATFRSAGIIAKSAATLDVLTGGRAFCGLGAGWWEREHMAFDLSFPDAAGRLDGLEEAAETLRALWAPGTKAYAGERVSLPETTCYPRPVGKLPLIIGGGGEQRTLRIAARWADACNVQGDLDTVRRKSAVLRRHCDDVGRPRDEVEVTVLDIAIVGTDRDDTWTRVERMRGRAKAATFAARHHAADVAAHRERHDRLFDEGVGTVFLALPDFVGATDIERIAALARRCAQVPAALACAAYALGFLMPGAEATVASSGRWTRLTTPAGHALTRS